MSVLGLERIVDAIALHEPVRYQPHANTREAAVAMILRATPAAIDALFILRATKDGDPWSGHMAFPGGHREESDGHLRETAIRETREEIDLDLGRHARFIGEIDAVRANPRGRDLDMIVTPFVFLLENHDASMDPNYEVADILWGSLNDMYTGDAITTGSFEVQGEHHRYPGYGVEDQIVWGLTYRMLDQFFGMMDPQWTPHA